MTELVTWLRGVLDDLEQKILDRWDSDGRARVATMRTGKEPGYTTVASDHCDGYWVADGHEVQDARHVQILWDPAAELADIAAKRAILDAGNHGDGWGDRIRFPSWDTPTCSDNCGPDVWRSVVKTLAAAHDNRPGYREEWRP